MLEITVNGGPREVAAGASVASLIIELDLGDRRVAVAVNRDVIPQADHASRILEAGDRVEIVQAVQGG